MRTIKSYCKINLSLRVLKKLKNGLHDIQTNTLLLNLHDAIRVNKISKSKDIIIFQGKFKKLINNSKNSITNTLSILRDNELINKKDRYKITIQKKIPVFSGLGGGTSNAAFLIKYFLKEKISISLLKVFEKKIGSDLRLFLNKQVHQQNLKRLKKYKKNFKFYFVLVYPYIKCSTKEIYSEIKRYSHPLKISTSSIMSENKFVNLLKKERNDLQEISTSKFEILRLILNFISIQEGCRFSRMTGSGSVCFGIFQSKELAILATKRIKKKFPKYWCVFAKTI